MTNLLIAFVIPFIVIIVAAILQTLLKCPFKVTGIVFVILIITALVLGGTLEYIALAWLYTLLALITAFVIKILMKHRNCITNGNGVNDVSTINAVGGVSNMNENDWNWNSNCPCSGNNFANAGNNIGYNNRGFNNIGNNNTGNNNFGNNNIGNNNTGNCNCGNNNFGNNNIGSNNGYNPYNANSCNRCRFSN